MKKNLTELVMILDRSGSMVGLEGDTIGGYNAMLKKQQDVEGDCTVTTVLFDNQIELLHDRIDIHAIAPITEKEYYVRGSTALMDAIGTGISKIEAVQKSTAEDYRADKVMFVIITDGYENASREYSADEVRHLIEQHKEQGWEFIFLGANIDAVKTADQFGIEQNRAVDYVADEDGTALSFEMMSETVASFRSCGTVPEACLSAIRSDHKKRKG